MCEATVQWENRTYDSRAAHNLNAASARPRTLGQRFSVDSVDTARHVLAWFGGAQYEAEAFEQANGRHVLIVDGRRRIRDSMILAQRGEQQRASLLAVSAAPVPRKDVVSDRGRGPSTSNGGLNPTHIHAIIAADSEIQPYLATVRGRSIFPSRIALFEFRDGCRRSASVKCIQPNILQFLEQQPGMCDH
jgi:hypothetical protein